MERMEIKKTKQENQINFEPFIKALEGDPHFSFLQELKENFKESKVYLVGGMVRDISLGNLFGKDFDFVVSGLEADKLEKFLKNFGEVNLVGRNFGVFKFVPQGWSGEAIDIALPRREHAEGTGGYRDFAVQSDPKLPIEEDLSRRDFTINAMALEMENGKLVDPFSGIKDLENKIIRAVGDPNERFKEDYSRMLRAIRFACQFNFEIEKETWQAIKKLMPKINSEKKVENKKERIIPYESIAKELTKSLVAHPVKTLELYEESGALQELMPELLQMKNCPQPKEFHAEGDVWEHTKLSLQILKSNKFKEQFPNGEINPELIFALLYHDVGKPKTIRTPEKDGTDRIRFDEHAEVGGVIARKTAERLALANFGIKGEKVEWLIKNHMLLLHGNYREMKNSTIEKYFFNKETGELSENGKNLLRLTFCDASATIPFKGKPDLENFNGMLKRIEELKALTKEKNRLPKPILNGHEIMEAFNLKPGKKIGEILELLREEQLAGKIKTKEEGLKFLKDKI